MTTIAISEFGEWEDKASGTCSQCGQYSKCLMDRDQYGWVCAMCRTTAMLELENEEAGQWAEQ